MSDIDERLTGVLERVEATSTALRLAALAGTLVLFGIARRLALVSATTLETTPTVVLASLAALVSTAVSVAVLAVVVGSFALELRGRGPPD